VHGADLSSCSGAGVNYSRSYPLSVPSRPLPLACLLTVIEILFFLYNHCPTPCSLLEGCFVLVNGVVLQLLIFNCKPLIHSFTTCNGCYTVMPGRPAHHQWQTLLAIALKSLAIADSDSEKSVRVEKNSSHGRSLVPWRLESCGLFFLHLAIGIGDRRRQERRG